MEPDLEFFQSIEWCAQLLADPDFVIIPTISRLKKESTLDELFAETLKTDNAIAACITLSKRPDSQVSRINEVRTILTLGYRLNGYPNVAHGGIVATILDEVMAILMRANRELENPTIQAKSVTVNLNVTYIKPVQTPQTVLVVAKIRDIKERKAFLEATIQSADRAVLAKGEAFWIGPKENL